MNVLLFASSQPRSGKTGVAAALALRAAYEGRKVAALRLGGDGEEAAARHDAAFYARQPYARGRGGGPLASVDDAVREAGDAELLFLEAPAGADVASLATGRDVRAVLCARWNDAFSADTLKAGASRLGETLAGVVVIAVPAKLVQETRAQLADAGLPALAVLPEDRTLYSPTLAELTDVLGGRVLMGEADDSTVIEHVQINPISADPGYGYFRRHGGKAVVTRSDKTDLQLAALKTDTDCLILTGGLPPSPYTLDHAASNETVLVLTEGDTNATVRHMEGVYARTRFTGERKLERMSELLSEHAYPDALARLLA